MADKWRASGARGSYRRTISWDEFEHFKQTGELPAVGSPSAIDGATWARPLRLAADGDVNKAAAEVIQAGRPLPDGCEGLVALTRDPALIDAFKQYHDMKVDKPNSLVLDLWLIKALYDAGYVLRDDGGAISLPLTGGARKAIFLEAVHRVFMNVVYSKLVTKAQRFLSKSNLVVPLFSRKLAGTERLLNHHKSLQSFLRKVRAPSVVSLEAHSHHVAQSIADAADKFDENYVSEKTGKKAKFTTYVWRAINTARFLSRDVLATAASLDAPIKKARDDDGKATTSRR
jgi:hypothetical protein